MTHEERLEAEVAGIVNGEIYQTILDLGNDPSELDHDADHKESLGLVAKAVIEAVRQHDLERAILSASVNATVHS